MVLELTLASFQDYPTVNFELQACKTFASIDHSLRQNSSNTGNHLGKSISTRQKLSPGNLTSCSRNHRVLTFKVKRNMTCFLMIVLVHKTEHWVFEFHSSFTSLARTLTRIVGNEPKMQQYILHKNDEVIDLSICH